MALGLGDHTYPGQNRPYSSQAQLVPVQRGCIGWGKACHFIPCGFLRKSSGEKKFPGNKSGATDWLQGPHSTTLI